ncbi:uncharacterized protein [Dermacentor albipictus]|uniref:uncharacterized protein n=1 Tax=Dermacentor albipictus TaxID=60249 RepID=UPI0031FBD61F
MARRAGAAGAAAKGHEERERSRRLRDKLGEPEASLLGAAVTPPVQSHGGLPRRSRQRKLSPSAHYQRAAGIQFTAFIEAIASDGDQQLQLWILLLKKAEWRLLRQQGRPASAHHQRTEARTTTLQPPEPSTHRARGPTAVVLTRGFVQGRVRSDFHEPAPCCELLFTRMAKRRHRSPLAAPAARSLFVERERPTIGGATVQLVCMRSRQGRLRGHRIAKRKRGCLLFGCATRPFAVSAGDIGTAFDNSCVGVALVCAAAAALLQDDAEGAQSKNGDAVEALPVVALLAQQPGELGEHLLLALGLGLLCQRHRRNYVCSHRLQAASHRGLCKKILAAVQACTPLIMESFELYLVNETPGCLRVKKMIQSLQFLCGVLAAALHRTDGHGYLLLPILFDMAGADDGLAVTSPAAYTCSTFGAYDTRSRPAWQPCWPRGGGL